jgi:hypothetical protein
MKAIREDRISINVYGKREAHQKVETSNVRKKSAH